MQPGDRIGHYELIEELGHGGMGTVFRAKDLNSSREIALKVLPPELSLNPALLQRFRREVMTLRQLRHPGIVRVLDVGADGRTNYFAMQYISGGGLDKLLEEQGGRLPIEQALDIIIQVAEALDYAHGKNIVHRDIKPSNILLTEGGHPKLTDFGIAKVVEATRMTVTGGIVGTVDYMAPEQAEGRAIGPRTDIYSLGVVLYQMITGRLPFKGETPSEVIQKHRFSLVEPPINLNPDMPENLSLVIEDMLQKDQSQRIPSTRALIKILTKIKSQMHPTDASRQPTRYNLEEFVPPDRDTSVDLAGAVAASGPPAPPDVEGAMLEERYEPRSQWRRSRRSYQRGPNWTDRLWLLLGILLILGIVGLIGSRIYSYLTYRELPAQELLNLGMEAEGKQEYDRARSYYERLRDVYPSSQQADYAGIRLRAIDTLKAWEIIRRRTWTLERDLRQMGRYGAARGLLMFIEKQWPGDQETIDEERKNLDRLEQIQKSLPSAEGLGEGGSSPGS